MAEGIEHGEEARLLQEAGCDLGQGFLFARPMAAAELDAFLLEVGTGAGRLLPASV